MGKKLIFLCFLIIILHSSLVNTQTMIKIGEPNLNKKDERNLARFYCFA